MSRCTFIFGNGLGMSLDPAYFSLRSGLQSAWVESEGFTHAQKHLVCSAIPDLTPENFPESEDQLDQLQVAIVAAEYLQDFESEAVEWLNATSRTLPQAFRAFVHTVACYFHSSGKSLPEDFAEPLCSFIQDSKSHVATLNYDNLLYDAFHNYKVCSGYSGTLIDGFLKSGFSKKNLDRNDIKKLGWYLHLHGSPLFVENGKLMGAARAFIAPDSRSHIVLTHVAHKPLVIASSPILKEYWSRLPKALSEAEKIILFGYSGCDVHLNELLAETAGKRAIHVMEWNGSGAIEDREAFWHKNLPDTNLTIHHFGNLLDFKEWHTL